MFTFDERLKGLPALKEQVMSLHESLNQPHLAVPGRTAGPAKAYILGLRGPSGFAVFVYLYLPESAEAAVYVPQNRAASAEQFEGEETEALAFVESMGFIMDNLNFRTRPAHEQDTMMKSFPVFQRDPKALPSRPTSQPGVKVQGAQAVQEKAQKNGTAQAIGKLFGSFVLLGVLAQSCAHVATEKEQREAQAHYDLAANMLQKEPQGALIELDRALALDPDMPEAHHARGLLLHVAFNHPEEAIASYKKALQLRPAFSECKVNLGNVYLDQKRYDEAIPLYREALNDMLYPTPYLAQGNLGWALYKKGETDAAISSIKSAVTLNPKFCLGFRNLGTIYDETGVVDEACRAFGKFRELCPDVADAYLREGVCLAKKGDLAGAHKSLQGCLEKSRVDAERDDCKRLKEGLGPPPPPQPSPEAGGR
jgi:Tfp pilus assembly protein PilF